MTEELQQRIAMLELERDELRCRCIAMEDLLAADPVRELVEWCKWFKAKEASDTPNTGKR
jgi:hypothetical protein